MGAVCWLIIRWLIVLWGSFLWFSVLVLYSFCTRSAIVLRGKLLVCAELEGGWKGGEREFVRSWMGGGRIENYSLYLILFSGAHQC